MPTCTTLHAHRVHGHVRWCAPCACTDGPAPCMLLANDGPFGSGLCIAHTQGWHVHSGHGGGMLPSRWLLYCSSSVLHRCGHLPSAQPDTRALHPHPHRWHGMAWQMARAAAAAGLQQTAAGRTQADAQRAHRWDKQRARGLDGMHACMHAHGVCVHRMQWALLRGGIRARRDALAPNAASPSRTSA